MDTFLKYIAEDLIQRFGNHLQQLVLVFPNKRASLFMNEYLAKASDQPVWAPTYISISELFRKFSNRVVPDKIQLVCELYPIYRHLRELTEENMPLDRFYSWGELLLSDFDDVDKNLVNAETLFSNLKDLKEMDTTDFLDEEQRAVLAEFFEHFEVRDTDIQNEFIRVWEILYPLYTQYKAHLKEQGMLYEGALFREVVEDEHLQEKLTAPWYVFIGFNVLDKAEETLFTKIQEAGKALFYWDYDPYYTDSKKGIMEAGHFLRKNLQKFGNALPERCFQSMQKPKEVEIISASTENAQVSYIAPWLKKNLTTEKESNTAVVLCNETLLEPVLHSLPEEVKHLNITMGFPLASTPVFSFIKTLCDLQSEGYSKEKGCYRFAEVRSVLLHPYASLLSGEAPRLLDQLAQESQFFPHPSQLQIYEGLADLFPGESLMDMPLKFLTYLQSQVEAVAQHFKQHMKELQDTFAPLYQEALYTAYTLLNRLINLVESGILTVNARTLVRFVGQLLGGASIPFHGEPIIGLQVMGVLETRCLDFKHLVLLSLNEGMLPKGDNNASYIPYNLRKAFGMTLIEQKVSVYAYYFYRLIQRAEKVTFIYNNNTEGLQKGEMSRFLLQYLIEHPENHHTTLKTLSVDQKPVTQRSISIRKTPEMMKNLRDHYQKTYSEAYQEKYEKEHGERKKDPFLSPSALNVYIDCPLKFYFKYVAHIQAPDEVTDDVDSALFGTIFHRCSEKIYIRLTHGQREGLISQVMVEDIKKNVPFLRETINDTIKEEVFKLPKEAQMPTLNGMQTIIQQVMLKYLNQLLEHDANLAPFTIRGLEMDVHMNFPYGDTPDEWIRIGGNIDRMDQYTNGSVETIRILDYKTSGSPQSAGTIDSLFDSTLDHRPYHALQTFFYTMQTNACGLNPRMHPLSPSLFYIQKAAGKEYKPEVKIKLEDSSKTTPVTDFEAQVGEEFRSRIRTCLQELFNPDGEFHQCENTGRCEYCDYKNICRK